MDLVAKIHYEDDGWRAQAGKAPLFVHQLKVTRVLFICISILARSLHLDQNHSNLLNLRKGRARAGGGPANFSNFSVRCVRARARRARAAFAFDGDGDDFSGWPQSFAISVPRRRHSAGGRGHPFRSIPSTESF